MKKILLAVLLICIFSCALTIAVGASELCAEGSHTPEWEVKSDNGVLSEARSMEICSSCGLVLSEEKIAPLVADKGFSYYNGSIVQGYRMDREAIEKFTQRAGKTVGYGIVVASRDAVGTKPLGADGTPISGNVIAVDLGKEGSEQIDIKVVSIPEGKMDLKIILCAYLTIDGQVIYIDNGIADTAAAGVSYNEVVDLLEKGVEPEGLYEYRKLTVEEMGILVGGYWFSTSSPHNDRITSKNDSLKNSATRMFTREELPSGSYVVLKTGWQFRPELWKVNENGEALKNTTRPYGSNLQANTYYIDEMWAKSEDFKYLAFNISPTDGFNANEMTLQGIAQAIEIYVPAQLKLESSEIEATNEISVKGMKLLRWDETNLFANSYWTCTTGTSMMSNNSTSEPFYATCQFTKETLPVGSVIEVSGGWMYRPEYWVNSSKIGVRPSITDVYRFVVTADFWDTESERAFNICQIVKEKVTEEQWDEVASSFRIYIPVK